MDECLHQYEARYDGIPNKELIKKLTISDGNRQGIKEVKHSLILKVYVKDICINCGKEVKR